ncbi:MAG: T9SS type A sorting domain-containing protein [Chitinophagales bacterium]|nr:T9SS type A sorting domain-containing protein [Chitinophagales bacterium]
MTNTFRANYSTSFEAQAILYLVRQIEFPVAMEHLPLPLPAYMGTLPTIHFKNDVGNTTAAMPIKVYPNPSNGLVNVILPDSYNGDVQLSLYSVDGKSLLNQKLYSGSNTLYLQTMQAGLYYYLIQLDGNVVERNKLILIK